MPYFFFSPKTRFFFPKQSSFYSISLIFFNELDSDQFVMTHSAARFHSSTRGSNRKGYRTSDREQAERERALDRPQQEKWQKNK